MNDVTWIGSSYFQSTSGFYDTYHPARHGPGLDATRDAGWLRWIAAAAIPPASSGGSMAATACVPGCWLQVDPDLLSRIGH